jgi:hypothetical protein
VDHDARQPRGKPGAFGKLRQVPERVEVGLLHDVFALGLVLHNRPRHPINPLVVPAHQLLEQRTLACADPGNQPLVAERRGRFGTDEVKKFGHGRILWPLDARSNEGVADGGGTPFCGRKRQS